MFRFIQARPLAASFCLALWVAPGGAEPPPETDAPSVAEMAERVRPAVVLVVVKTGDEGPIRQATGFVVSPDGRIATCLHVLDGAEAVMVKTSRKRRFTGVFIDGLDAEKDLAILRIDARDLPALELGDSTALDPGDPIVVIGNPLGLMRTVTEGVVSGRRKTWADELDAESWMEEDFGGGSPIRGLYGFEVLQISAQVSHGSSGAPVLDPRGMVIGVAASGLAHGLMDLNFAIPVEDLEPLLDQRLALDLRSFQMQADGARRSLAEPLLAEARIALELGRPEDAEKALDRALVLHPRFVEALLLQATLLEAAGEREAAEGALIRAAEEGDEESAEAWSRLGELYLGPALRDGNIERRGLVITSGGEPLPGDQAMSAFERALEIDEEDARAARGIGKLHFSAGRYRQAVAWLERSLESDPELLDAGVQLGEAHRMLGQLYEAEEAYRDVLREDRDHALAHFGLAHVGMARRDGTLAREHWREFLELAEADPALEDLRERAIAYLERYMPDVVPR